MDILEERLRWIKMRFFKSPWEVGRIVLAGTEQIQVH